MKSDLMTLAHSLLVHYGSEESRPPELEDCPTLIWPQLNYNHFVQNSSTCDIKNNHNC